MGHRLTVTALARAGWIKNNNRINNNNNNNMILINNNTYYNLQHIMIRSSPNRPLNHPPSVPTPPLQPPKRHFPVVNFSNETQSVERGGSLTALSAGSN